LQITQKYIQARERTDLHHGDAGVDAGRQRDLDGVLVALHAHAHALLNVCGCNALAKSHDKLGNLLHVDHVPEHTRGELDAIGSEG
jgi:hypothetical protein